LEYGLTKTAIAQRLGIHRTTFDEHFSAAEKKLKLYADKERADKNLAKVKPGSIRTR
jgi:DNA-binding NarL/FixJ family response regulator